jgi:quercetin dioxygenase-like cupin family protein
MDEMQKDQKDASTHGSAQGARSGAPLDDESLIELDQEVAQLHADMSSEQSGRRSKMLVKYPEFRIVLITMRAESQWEDHKTSARICLHLLRGHIRFHTPNKTVDLKAGQLLTLAPSVIHSVDALEDTAFLLTLSDQR